jgi:tetratricopeptide (TPR) repeat protein
MRLRVALLVGSAVLSLARVLPADNTNNLWLLFEQGNAAASQKEYGKALQLYKSAIEGAGIFPEAEAAIGDVFMEEGEASLAQRQYEKAYDMRKSFYIPNDQYAILYKLVNLFEIQQFYKQMEDTLGNVVADDKRFQDTPNQRLRSQVEKNYLEKGLDRVIQLYTFDDTFAAPAHSKLGWFYYRTGRFTQAISQLLFSVVYRASEIERAARERDVEQEFPDLASVLAVAAASPDLAEYGRSAGLYKDLYYLAGSTFAAGYPSHSTAIWKLLSASKAAGQYADLSTRQLKKAFIEPLLTVQR